MRILISACLLGLCCRYDGGSKPCEAAIALKDRHALIPVCPEQLGGLPTPRTPSERAGDRVTACDGQDRTAEYVLGAMQAERLFDLLRCECAVLKARSPMCGKDTIYDGTFTHTLIPGSGVLAQRLLGCGVPVYTEEELPDLTDIL